MVVSADNQYWKSIRSAVIVHHSYTPTNLIEGELLAFLLPRIPNIVMVTHPFLSARDGVGRSSRVRVYKNSSLQRAYNSLAGHGPEIFYYLRDCIVTLWTVLRFPGRVSLYFGVDNLNAAMGIILRWVGKVDRVIFYVIDYVPQRFSRPWLNALYHGVDRFCVRFADETWNLSDEMGRARQKAGIDSRFLVRQRTVPVGCHPLESIAGISRCDVDPFRIVYLGILDEEQGVMTLIHAVQSLRSRYPSLQMLVIGSGPLFTALREYILSFNLEKTVELKGFVQSEEEVMELLRSCHIGVAPYRLTAISYKGFTDPGKVKTYFGAGLPVVMTKISHIANTLVERNAGTVVEDSVHAVAGGIEGYLLSRELYRVHRANAIELGRQFDWNTIFTKAFEGFFANYGHTWIK